MFSVPRGGAEGTQGAMSPSQCGRAAVESFMSGSRLDPGDAMSVVTRAPHHRRSPSFRSLARLVALVVGATALLWAPAERAAAADPSISNVTASGILADSATVTWTTDVPTDSQIEIGTTANYTAATPLDANLVTAHSQVLPRAASEHPVPLPRQESGQRGHPGDVRRHRLHHRHGLLHRRAAVGRRRPERHERQPLRLERPAVKSSASPRTSDQSAPHRTTTSSRWRSTARSATRRARWWRAPPSAT